MSGITNAIINFFQELFHNDILTIITIGIFPIIELRGAIPVAFKLGMTWYEALFFCWLGSSLVAPILLLLLKPVLNWMKKFRIFRSLADAVESVFTDKARKVAEKANNAGSEKKATLKKMIGVYAFVAVPLPLTGVWTGSAVAVFLGLSFWRSLAMVLLGNLTAGIIMTILSVCFRDYVDIILGVFLIIVVVVLLLYIVMLIVRMKKNKNKSNDNATCDSIENGKETAMNNDIKDSEENISNSDGNVIDAGEDNNMTESDTLIDSSAPDEINRDGKE